MSTNYKITGTRVGLNPNLKASDIDKIASFSSIDKVNPALVDASDFSLLKENEFIKDFRNKNTKKTINYINKIESGAAQRYFGARFSNGWIDETNFGKVPIQRLDPFGVSKDYIPYTDERSTGFYVNAKWSGYNYPWDDNKVIAGIINDKVSGNLEQIKENNKFFPYKNFHEIFLHSGYVTGDIGTNDGKILNSQYSSVGYNAIFFMSGLNRDNMLDYEVNPQIPKTKILFLRKNNERDFSYHTMLGKYRPYKEELMNNDVRGSVFLYTGDLPIIYTPKNTARINGFGYGPLIQEANKAKYKLRINNNFSLNFTGVYPEYTNKNFTVFNTGNTQEYFYIVADNGLFPFTKSNRNKLEYISEHMSKNTKINLNPNLTYIHSGENNRLNGYIFEDNIHILGAAGATSNINFRVEIDGESLGTGIKTKYINIYRITGVKALNNQTGAFLTQEYKIPVNVNLIYNDTKITRDDYYFTYNNSKDYQPSYKIGEPMILTNSGILNIGTQKLNFTLYSTGSNLEKPSVKNEIEKRVKRKYGT